MHKKFPVLLAVAAVFGLGTPVVANASLTCSGAGLTGAGSWSCSEFDYSPVENNTFGSFVLDQWLASAGNGFSGPGLTTSLNSIAWSVNGIVITSGTLTNVSDVSRTINFNQNGKLIFSASPGSPSSFLTNPQELFNSDAFLPQTLFTLASLVPADFGTAITLGPIIGSTTNTSGWIGAGTFGEEIQAMTDDALIGTGANDVAVDFNADYVQSAITLTYSGTTLGTVIPTPEPGTFGVVGASFAAMGIARRRRK